MEINRRSLLKGLLVGGAFLALGEVPWTMAQSAAKPRGPVFLVLGGTQRDAAFAAGAQTATRMAGKRAVPVYRIADRFGPDPDLMSNLFYPRRPARMIGIMDDGMYAVIHELARTADARLVCLGRHACGGNAAFTHRHAMLSASPRQSVGAAVVSQLTLIDQNFLVSEVLLDDRSALSVAGNAVLPGFTSYQVEGNRPVRLHLSGLSVAEGCDVLGLSSAGVTRCATSVVDQPKRIAPNADWDELLGQAMMQVGIGAEPSRMTGATQVFLHRGSAVERRFPAEAFVTFIMDV
jgi:hypothetical protein